MSTSTAPVRPPVDPELDALLAALPPMAPLDAGTLPQIRPYSSAPVEPLLEGRAVDRAEHQVRTGDGHELALSVFSPRRPSGRSVASVPTACVYWLHGGGRVMGDRFAQIDIPLGWLDALGVTVVTVEYRLAPEASGTTPVEDGMTGLRWVSRNAGRLGIDPRRIVVAGISAGGGLAAAVALAARDEGDVAVAAQVLMCPMLDHRNVTTSSRQFTGPGVWSREANEFAWSLALAGVEPAQIGPRIVPATAADLAGLPPTYVDAGSAEVFRDEAIAYAGRLWEAGNETELHVWSGGVHGFDAVFPEAVLSRQARRARIDWLRRTLPS